MVGLLATVFDFEASFGKLITWVNLFRVPPRSLLKRSVCNSKGLLWGPRFLSVP